MFIIGDLKDQMLALDIQKEINDKGLNCELFFSEKEETYVLATKEESQLHEAREIYRIKIGFPKQMEVDQEWVKIKTLPRGVYTYGMILFCVGIFGLSYLSMGKNVYDLMFISRPESSFLGEVLRGQIWRLITPIFLHLSILHILFNMMWFKDLGYIMEYKFGRKYLLLFMGVTGVFSNLLQYCVSGPSFGGMSGVLYALLGFIWIHKKLNPSFDYSLPGRDIGIMLGWLILCLTGFLGPIANTAHAAGLFAGMLFAVFHSASKWGKEHIKYFCVALFFLFFTVGVEGWKLGGRYFVLLWF